MFPSPIKTKDRLINWLATLVGLPTIFSVISCTKQSTPPAIEQTDDRTNQTTRLDSATPPYSNSVVTSDPIDPSGPSMEDCRPKLMERALNIAREFRDQFVGEEHLLLAICDQSDGPMQPLQVDRSAMIAAMTKLRKAGGGSGHEASLPSDPRLLSVLTEAEHVAHGSQQRTVQPIHILAAYFLTADSFGAQIMNEVGLDASRLTAHFPELPVLTHDGATVTKRLLAEPEPSIPRSETLKSCLQDAERIARDWKYEFVGTEHALLALMSGSLDVQNLLQNSKIDPQQIGIRLQALMKPGTETIREKALPMTPPLLKALQRASVEARAETSTTITPVLFLIGLVAEPRGIAGQTLREAGLTVSIIKTNLATAGEL